MQQFNSNPDEYWLKQAEGNWAEAKREIDSGMGRTSHRINSMQECLSRAGKSLMDIGVTNEQITDALLQADVAIILREWTELKQGIQRDVHAGQLPYKLEEIEGLLQKNNMTVMDIELIETEWNETVLSLAQKLWEQSNKNLRDTRSFIPRMLFLFPSGKYPALRERCYS